MADHPDFSWCPAHHGPTTDKRHNRASLHLRKDGRNYHVGLLLPRADERFQMARLNALCSMLNSLGAVVGQEWVGREVLQFPAGSGVC